MSSNRYNRCVRLNHLHDWNLTISESRDLQNHLALEVSRLGSVVEPRFIAGIDVSIRKSRGIGTAAVVVLEYPSLELVETKTIQGNIDFPYVPGLLSFREAPLILKAYEQLTHTPDLIMVDGQGIAHPRRLGIAAHLGLFFDIPTIGCAKSRLCGTHQMPTLDPGYFEELIDDNETIGVALCTKHNTKPVYISIGNKIALEDAIYWVMCCCRGYRLPEPIRFAHQAAGGNLILKPECATIGN
jgi:deoxyribonuclease V